MQSISWCGTRQQYILCLHPSSLTPTPDPIPVGRSRCQDPGPCPGQLCNERSAGEGTCSRDESGPADGAGSRPDTAAQGVKGGGPGWCHPVLCLVKRMDYTPGRLNRQRIDTRTPRLYIPPPPQSLVLLLAALPVSQSKLLACSPCLSSTQAAREQVSELQAALSSARAGAGEASQAHVAAQAEWEAKLAALQRERDTQVQVSPGQCRGRGQGRYRYGPPFH
jgi:hypothetical protein